MFGYIPIAANSFATAQTVGIISVGISESLTATQLLSANLTQPVFVSEAITVSDAIDYQLSLAATISESGTAVDSAVLTFTYSVNQAETVTAATTQSSINTMVVSAAEALSANDAYANTTIFVAQIIEVGTLIDTEGAAGSIYNVNLSNAINAQDSMTRRLLWEPEPDSNLPNWTPESDVSTVWVKKDDNTGIWTIINPEGLPPQ